MGRTGTKSLATAMKILGYSSKHGGSIQDVKDYEFLNDIGIAVRYKFLDFYYGPTAKFILTYQDVESWINAARYVAGAKGGRRGNEGVIKGTIPVRAENRFMMYGIAHFDEKIMRKAHEKHNREVVEHFKDHRDRLLIMNIVAGDGWNTLCLFLDKPVPEIPFPHKHKTGQW